MGQIQLENMEFYAHHGHYAEEQTIGNRFQVSLNIDTDLKKPAVTDNLNDTIDYSKVYEVVKREMGMPSKLLENLAGRILNSLHKEFNGLEKVTVKITKLNPPLGGKTEGVSVVLTK
ncbi:MAG: dihydroneopterin aldolase [Bacteroidales bacterium]|nr:dihydroneopterin aldolase [Bacteroidales bacterium]